MSMGGSALSFCYGVYVFVPIMSFPPAFDATNADQL